MKSKKKSKKRIDFLLKEKGFVSSREKAQALILAGKVIVNDVKITKAGEEIAEDALIRVSEPEHPYVSRGALKLIQAIEDFQIKIENKICMDVGASTGGFTEVLLLNGAKKIFAVDVGINQLDWKIRSDARVFVKEKYNARYLKEEDFESKIDLFVFDVSFISLNLVVPPTLTLRQEGTEWVTLIKPQFEVGPAHVGKGGIVKSEERRIEAVENITKNLEKIGLKRKGLIESPIKGTKGNIEFLALWRMD